MNQRLIHIGQNLRKLRELRGFNQLELSKQIGLTQSHISRIEQGEMNISLETLFKFADALECYIDISFTPVEK